MELLEKLDQFIEQEEEKEKIFILSGIVKTQLKSLSQKEKEINEAIVDWFTKYVLKSEFNEKLLFSYLIGIKPAATIHWSDDVKEQFVELLEKSLEKISLHEDFYQHFFYKEVVRPIKERIRKVVNGKSVKGIKFLTKEEELEFFGYLKKMATLAIKRVLLLDKEKDYEEFIESFIAVLTTYSSFRRVEIKEFLNEDNLKRFFGEKWIEIIKEQIHEWYQSVGKSIIQIYNIRFDFINDIDPYKYLLDDNQKEKIKERYIEKLKEDFTEIESEKGETALKNAKRLKKELIMVLEW